MEKKIDITHLDLVSFIKNVYALSEPVGLGFMHFTKEPLTDAEAQSIIDTRQFSDTGLYPPKFNEVSIHMDYVKGRACKMVVWEEDGKLTIKGTWFDHTEGDLRRLLSMTELKEK